MYDDAGRVVTKSLRLVEAGLEKGMYVKEKNKGDNPRRGIVDKFSQNSVGVRLVGKDADGYVECPYEEWDNSWALEHDKETVTDKFIVYDWQQYPLANSRLDRDTEAKALVAS